MNAAGIGISYLVGPYIVPDHFMNKTGETDHSEQIPLTNYAGKIPSRDDEKHLIWCYSVGMAALAVVIFIAMVIYFPSKPKIPPTASASPDAEQLHFKESMKKLVADKSVMLCFVGFSICTGVQGAWGGVMTLNFEPLGVGDEQAGYIGVSAIAAGIVVGIVVAQFTDRMRRHIKWTLIFALLFTTICWIWMTLIVLKVITYQYIIQLYVSTICAGSFSAALMLLFFEYTVEMAYPVPEGIAGGLLTLGNNVVGILSLMKSTEM